MRVIHLMRKYNPAEWGGTETAVQRLVQGLRHHGVSPVAFAPRLEGAAPAGRDPLVEAGAEVKRFTARVPVWGIGAEQREQLISVGGNLLSFDLPWKMMREPGVALIHTHAGNRLGGIALRVAQARRIPLVASIHGGVLDLPAETKAYLQKPLEGGVEWGKIFGLLLQSRRVLERASAIFTCNKKEAELLRQKYPGKRIVVQAHGVTAKHYEADQRAVARRAYPQIEGRRILLAVGRIDPVKNQRWLLEQFPTLLRKFPDTLLVLAGSCTDAPYGKVIEKQIEALGLQDRVLLTGGIPPGDARLLGLFQSASVVVLPSISETFGLVILEAWAAGAAVLASRTSGALDLIEPGRNGWLFDLESPEQFQEAAGTALSCPGLAVEMARAGRELVLRKYDTVVLGGEVKKIYEELIEEKR